LVRLAATVMLVRPGGEHGFEVFMLRRSAQSRFVPDAYVFPGGTVDDADLSDLSLARTCGASADEVAAQFRARPAPAFPAPLGAPSPREGAGLLIAGTRELFEEAGVLLACDARGVPIPDERLAPHRERLHAARSAVRERTLRFGAFLSELGVYANARALLLFSQWITPTAFPRRYNAHFFVALASPEQAAVADAVETHDGVWIAPRRALAEHAEGRFAMVYPTIKHVERLAQFAGAAQLLEFTKNKTIYTIMPETPGNHRFSLPPELESAW
jgi:8-oxo-dGTP pyrophosphatase MutT (NUDIX family)